MRLETLADICLSTEPWLTSLISVCGDGRRRECRWGRGRKGEKDTQTVREKDDQAVRVARLDN